MGKGLLIMLAVTLLSANAQAGQWTWPIESDASVKADICPLMYGKKWAYAVEIDDGPQHLITVIQPLLARFHYTDAPPGVTGGNVKPFVGGAGVILTSSNTGHPIHLSWEQMMQLQHDGWEIINHGYAHIGRSWGNPPQILNDAQMDDELFWSQSILGSMVGQGRAPVTFIYPNGYTDYKKRLTRFGLQSGSRVGGTSTKDLYAAQLNLMDLTRRYLDDGNWKNSGKGDPLYGFPKDDGPADHELIIDFTHNIDKPATENHQRWETRLTHIAKHYGMEGDDSIWASSTGRIISYVQQAKVAKVVIASGKLILDYADDLPGTALTVHLFNVPASVKLNVPDGGLLYRKGTEVWLTTPTLGKVGSPLPTPTVKRIYDGAVADVQWQTPVKVAGIRIFQASPVDEDFALNITLTDTQGKVRQIIPEAKQKLGKTWSRWLLFPICPNDEPITATQLQTNTTGGLKQMEIWGVE